MSYKCFSLENLIMHLLAVLQIPLHSLVMSNLRHLDVVSAKTLLSPCGLTLDPVFVLQTKATR